MKKIEAIIRKERFSNVNESLRKMGTGGLTYFEVMGRGRLRGDEMVSARGTRAYREEYFERIKIEIIVKDDDLERIVEEIIRCATTDSVGDGKIIVSSVDRIIDIGSGNEEEQAI